MSAFLWRLMCHRGIAQWRSVWQDSAVRIIAGKAGRLAIKVPKAVTRPTTDFVRQAIFSILGERVEGAVTLDLFAGSGAIGLEALSRGAASCVFIDEHRQAEIVIRENLAKAQLEGGRIVKADAHLWLVRDTGCYDLIFADPPYAKYPGDRDHLKELMLESHLRERLADGGILIAECAASTHTPVAAGWQLVDRREYGSSAILLYAAAEAS
jgi:16S rRNA (guanine966-N2)-methyltransferase